MAGSTCGEESELRQQLDSLLALARDNEDKLRRFNELELKLIATTSLPDLLGRVVLDLPADFGLDHSTLTLMDPQGELASLLDERGLVFEHLPQVSFESSLDPLAHVFPADGSPFLGPFVESEHASLFVRYGAFPSSVALLPLKRGGEFIGSLNLGSLEADRFPCDSRTDFLDRLGAIVAICLENCANHERLSQLGVTDPLTGVNNRRYFQERLIEEISAAVRHKEPLACMFLDVDRFKNFNDSHGHQAGDEVLREIAVVIRSQLRRSDVVCRYGGEEFVVLMPGIPREAAQEKAEGIRKAVETCEFLLADNAVVKTTLSIGVAVLVDADAFSPDESADSLVRTADQAVYEAKALGRNRVVLADSLVAASGVSLVAHS